VAAARYALVTSRCRGRLSSLSPRRSSDQEETSLSLAAVLGKVSHLSYGAAAPFSAQRGKQAQKSLAARSIQEVPPTLREAAPDVGSERDPAGLAT
jgi:hypothetical protein